MINKTALTKLFVATKSAVKNQALKEVLSTIKFYNGVEILPFDVQPVENPPQPINSGKLCAERRIALLKEENPCDTKEAAYIAIESEIRDNGDISGPEDVCHVIVSRGDVTLHSFSTPIPVPLNYYQMAQKEAEALEGGLSITVGEIIEKNVEGVDAKNWMKEEQFGGWDRLDQLKAVLHSALGKLVIEDKVAYYPNFPRDNVTFKDLSFALGDPECLKLIVKLNYLNLK